MLKKNHILNGPEPYITVRAKYINNYIDLFSIVSSL